MVSARERLQTTSASALSPRGNGMGARHVRVNTIVNDEDDDEEKFEPSMYEKM
jgi:hypothetical protein